VPRSFTVTKGNQTITFANPGTKTFDQSPITVSATASSGLTVTFTSTTTGVCTSGGTNGATITFVATGTCTIKADQAGDTNWNAASPVSQSFAITKGDQTISFTSTAPSDATVGGATYTATATATSGLTVTFSSATTSVCTSSGTNGATITFVGAGTCTINADQAGNGNWNAAPTKTQSFSVSTPWAYSATGATQTWTSSTAKNVSYPSGTASGDLVLLELVQQNNTAAPTISGWNQLGTVNKGATVRLTVYWRASGGETSVSLTPPANSAAWVVRYTHTGGAPTLAATATTGSGNGSPTIDGPNVTTNATNATVISFAGIPAANTLSLSVARSFTLRNAATSSSPSTAFGLADRFVAASGTAVTAPQWQQSGTAGDWALITGAFH
jgi:hypothetical protein